MTLRTRLTVIFLLVALAPLLVGGALVLRVAPGTVQAGQEVALQRSATLAAELLKSRCERATDLARGVAQALADAPAWSPEQAQAAVARVAGQVFAGAVKVTDAQGRVVAQRGELPEPVGDCVQRRPGTAPVQARQVLLQGPEGAAGSVVAALPLDGQVVDVLSGESGEGAVLGPDGAVLLASGDIPRQLLRLVPQRQALVRTDGWLAAAQPAGPLTVVLAEPRQEFDDLLPEVVGVVVAAALLATLIALLLARAFTRPLAQLGAAADRIARGDLSTRLSVRSRDEVGQLALAFDAMTEHLREHVGQLEASRDELRASLARLGDTLSGTHDAERILAVVLDAALAATRAPAGAALLVVPESDELVVAAARGLPEPLRAPLGVGVAGSVALTGEPYLGRTGAEAAAAPGEPAGREVLAVPLRTSGQLLGVLALYGPGNGGEVVGFDDDDLARVRTLAGQAAIAVENVRLHLDVQRMAVTDGLTGLGNRRHLAAVLSGEVDRATRYGRPLALLLLDLDRFKQVNDSYGHPRGDAVLVEFACRVRSAVRDVDTVARFGGEEIAVVLPETDAAGAAQAAERVWDAVRRRPFTAGGEPPLPVTVSIGVAVFPAHAATPDGLLAAADAALYAAKAAGRDRWRAAGLPPVAPRPTPSPEPATRVRAWHRTPPSSRS